MVLLVWRNCGFVSVLVHVGGSAATLIVVVTFQALGPRFYSGSAGCVAAIDHQDISGDVTGGR